MSVWRPFRKANVEQKSSLATPEAWLVDLFGATPAASGIAVTPSNAMRCTAVRRAVQAIAEPVGQLPLHVFHRTGDARIRFARLSHCWVLAKRRTFYEWLALSVLSEDMKMAEWKAADLEWGRGHRVFEMFLEPTCPFSNKAFGKIKELLSTAGEDRITVKVRLHSQPWHLYSGVIVRAILAASTLDDGRKAAWRVMAAVAAHREEFEFDKHCTGPNRAATPNDIIARIERYSGIKLAAAFDIPDLDKAVKMHCRYSRQNGIHVSPTFMIDGLVQSDISSGDAVSAWAERLVGGK
jgi:hypothetical protein